MIEVHWNPVWYGLGWAAAFIVGAAPLGMRLMIGLDGNLPQRFISNSGVTCPGLIQDKLVLGENVSQTAQFATSGSAQGGIIAYSLALAPSVAKLGNFALIPDSWHEPLKQRMVLLKGADHPMTAALQFRQPKCGTT